MDDRVSRMERQIRDLAERLASVQQRLASLEAVLAAPGVPATGVVAVASNSGTALFALPGSDVATIVALVGRTLVILGGAYLIRALSDAGILAARAGMLLGLGFAVTWIALADRAAARGRRVQAAFHGAAFVLIALPLLYEAVVRFGVLDGAAAAGGLAGITGLGLFVAARRRLPELAWCTTIAALGAAMALMLATTRLGSFACFLVLLGVATLWLGYLLDWTLLRWPVAVAADLTIVVLAGRAVTAGVADAPGTALVVLVLLLLTYLGSFAARTLYLGRDVIPFEVFQSVFAILVGLGGMGYVVHATGAGTIPLGIATLTLAGCCYGAALAFMRGGEARRRNFFFYTSAGFVFVLAGAAFTWSPPTLALVYAGMGLVMACSGGPAPLTFRTHTAAYLTVGGAVSGLFGYVAYGAGLPQAPTGALSAGLVGVLAACALSVWALRTRAGVTPRWFARVPLMIVLVLTVGGLLGLADAVCIALLSGPDPAAGTAATVRTALLVLAVLLLATGGRQWRWTEGAWLVYPLLVIIGMKFVLEDFPAGRPTTLVIGFTLYGLALIVGPWLGRRARGELALDATSVSAPR